MSIDLYFGVMTLMGLFCCVMVYQMYRLMRDDQSK